MVSFGSHYSWNSWRFISPTSQTGCGSKWKTDVGPQMEMSSLVLTIQLLRYLILTHTQLNSGALLLCPDLLFSSFSRFLSGGPFLQNLLRPAQRCNHTMERQQPWRNGVIKIEYHIEYHRILQHILEYYKTLNPAVF